MFLVKSAQHLLGYNNDSLEAAGAGAGPVEESLVDAPPAAERVAACQSASMIASAGAGARPVRPLNANDRNIVWITKLSVDEDLAKRAIATKSIGHPFMNGDVVICRNVDKNMQFIFTFIVNSYRNDLVELYNVNDDRSTSHSSYSTWLLKKCLYPIPDADVEALKSKIPIPPPSAILCRRIGYRLLESKASTHLLEAAANANKIAQFESRLAAQRGPGPANEKQNAGAAAGGGVGASVGVAPSAGPGSAHIDPPGLSLIEADG